MDAYRPNFDWQPEHEECVRSMWLAGTSARDIATALNGIVSRGAVIGKVNRLGLMKSPERVILKPIRPKREGEWRRLARATGRPRGRPRKAPPLAPIDPPEPINPIRFVARSFDQCAWIEGDPKAKPHDQVECCGRKVRFGKSWCNYHIRIVYGPEAT
jgi:hypothetical protein